MILFRMQNANWHPVSKCQFQKTSQNKTKEISHPKDYIAHNWITSKLLFSAGTAEFREAATYFLRTCIKDHVSIQMRVYFSFVVKTCVTSGT